MEFTKKDWVIIAPATAKLEHEEAYTCLIERGITPKEFILGDTLRAFLRANGLDELKVNAFHKGVFIGDAKRIETYFEAVRKYKDQLELDI